MIDQATIDRIMDAAQIVDVVSEFVTLRRRGVNYVGLCPFHNEKTPSFSVSPSKGLCKCFSCGKGGNAVHFIMEHEQLNYYEAMKWLAKKYGIEVKERELSNEEKQAQNARESLFVINEFACDYFQHVLHNHPDGQAVGMAYFRQRGFRDDIIKKFRLGFSTEQHDALVQEAKQKGFNVDYLIKTGLCYTRDDGRVRDRFWGRVMFPVHTLSGKVVAFGGRVLKTDSKTAKYVNSPESEIYHKSRELYGIYFAKQAIVKKDKCFLVEGYTDVISMHQAGVENVVASSGTSLTSGQIRMIHRFTNNITVLYDGDMAGIKASIRGIDMLLEEGMNIKVMLLPYGDDPDSFARKHSATEFQEYIAEHEVDFIRFKTNLLMSETANDPFKRATLIADIVKSISVIPEAIVRSEYIKECSQMLHVEEKILVNEVGKLKKQEDERKAKKDDSPLLQTDNRQRTTDNNETPDLSELSHYSTPTFHSSQPLSPLYSQELLIVQQLIRYGEKTAYVDDNSGKTYSIGEYVATDLEHDEITFTTPLFSQILQELIQHIKDDSFVAERYFIAHPNPEISKLAAELAEEKYQLSKYHSKTQTVVSEVERLGEIIPHLLIDYKMSIVDMQLKETLEQLRQPDVKDNTNKCMETMTRYQQLKQLKQQMAKMLGDRVIDV